MFKKKTEQSKKQDVPPVEQEEDIKLPDIGGLKCACGNPVAPGQDQVCQKHIRTN